MLSFVGMVGTIVHEEVVDQSTTEAIFGKHAFHRVEIKGVLACLQMGVERLFHQQFGCEDALTAGIAGVCKHFAVGPLVAGETHFVGVNNDYVVAAHGVGCVARLVFPAKDFCYLRA